MKSAFVSLIGISKNFVTCSFTKASFAMGGNLASSTFFVVVFSTLTVSDNGAPLLWRISYKNQLKDR